MALESWLIKVKTAISDTVQKATSKNAKRCNVGVLAFEIAGLMSKLLHLSQSLSDNHLLRLRNHSIALDGVRKIVSNDDAFLLALACAEMVEALRLLAPSIARLGKRCDDPALRQFDRFFHDFAETGRDVHGWAMSWKDMEARAAKKMNRHVAETAALHKQIDELADTEHALKKLLLQCGGGEGGHESPIKIKKIADLQQKLFWQKQEVKRLKESSLWNRSFDTVTSLLARSAFTVLARIKLVFGVGCDQLPLPPPLHRSLSVSATVHPSENPASWKFISGPLTASKFTDHGVRDPTPGFFESNKKMMKPPASTLGAAALSLHYANLIIVIEKMVRSPQLIGADARDDLYAMLPTSVRAALRARLRGVGFSASDSALAAEWRDALWRILEWLGPLAHNMIKWQSERSFEQQQNTVPRRPTTASSSVLLLQTLVFANQAKTEAAITELLVGLNYIWRYEREMNAKALLDWANAKEDREESAVDAVCSPTSPSSSREKLADASNPTPPSPSSSAAA